MNEFEILNKQKQREEQQRNSAFTKFKKNLKDQAQRNDGSNTEYARFWKQHAFSALVEGLENEINQPGTYIRSGRATNAIKNCLGTPLVHKKNKDTGLKEIKQKQQRNYFDLDLCAFVTLQMAIDNSLSSVNEVKAIDKRTGKLKSCKGRVTYDKLVKNIGERIEQQLYFGYVNNVFPQFFKEVSKRAEGGENDTPRSSSYYWRYNVKRAIDRKKESLRAEGSHLEADALDWKAFTTMERKHVGAWLLAGCIKYTGLFQERIQRDKDSQNVFLILSDAAEEHRETYINTHQPFIWEDLPLICLPVEATKDNYGSWLTTIEQSKPITNKGELKPSQEHLQYINHLQSVPYKINPLIADLMDLLIEKGWKLGKFVPHFYEDPLSIPQRLGLDQETDRAEQTKLLINHPRFKDLKKERSIEIARQIRMVELGHQSKEVWLAVKKLREYPELYFPYSWDFRGRAYCRCTNTPSPQGTDYPKALLKFAKEFPLDDRSKHYMSIELANHAGMDKLNFDQRLKWTENHQREIKLVATMLEPQGDITGALSFLESVDNPFQFLATAEEYFHCFIKRDRHTTSIRCGVDATCSGAAIMAGIRRCKTGATLVNVFPSNEPQDLYKACWEALVRLNESQSIPPIRKELLRLWTDKKFGRAAAKKIIMVAQYSAGIQKQMTEFYEYHDELAEHFQMNKSEVSAFRKLWPEAMESVCSFKFVVDWFKSRVEEAYKNGKKEVVIPQPSGSTQIMRYPIYNKKRVKSFHHGSLSYTPTDYEPTKEPDIKKWLSSITANTIHGIDASLMVIALKDFPYSFSTIHDAAHTYAGRPMDEMIQRLKNGYIEAVSFNIWDEFRSANDLPIEPETSPPIVGNLDLETVLKSDYMFS